MTGFRIEKLRRDHPVDSFTCGRDELDRFLIRYALGNQQANASQTEEMSGTASALLSHAVQLSELVGRFRLESDNPNQGRSKPGHQANKQPVARITTTSKAVRVPSPAPMSFDLSADRSNVMEF